MNRDQLLKDYADIIDKLKAEMNVGKEKIKHLQKLLYEAIDYINHEKHLRNVHEGEDPRLDKEADALVAEIKEQFTLVEWEKTHRDYLKK
jgi:hypothetical protein